ncbi:cysteine desulfurase [Actinophytocola sp.]|uniref:aminotransferase class V-fold PLP-dependent enzyme n=1 Tax=Actinophytocola sp. TaxID=1872138 RepID=UPI002ED8463D
MTTAPERPIEQQLSVDEWAHRTRASFPFFAQGADAVVYLDNGATTQKPASVIDAMSSYYATANVNGGRGMYKLSMAGSETYHRARISVANFIGAADATEVVFTKNATESTNFVAHSFGNTVVEAGDEVVISGLEHHSNMLPWRQLCERKGARLVVVPTERGEPVSPEVFERYLSSRVKLAAVTHISNVLGTVNPVADLARVAHRHGVPILVDGAQAVARRPVDVQEIDADFYVFSAHKMYGPTGVGVLYAKREHLDRMPLHHAGGGTAIEVSYERELRLMPVPYRFEPGTPNIAGAVGLAAAVDYLESLGWPQVVAHDESLVVAAVAGLSEIDGVQVLGDPVANRGGIVSFNVDGVHPYDVGNHLNDHGIAVRTGVHCAIPLLDSLSVVGTVRVSFGVYNTMAEVDHMLAAVRTVTAGMWTNNHPEARFLLES